MMQKYTVVWKVNGTTQYARFYFFDDAIEYYRILRDAGKNPQVIERQRSR
jgi:hypothetical protein